MPMPRITPPRRLPRPAALAALIGAALLLAGCAEVIPGMYPPEGATEQGREIRDLYDIVFYIAAAIFLVVEGVIIYAVIRYRRRPTDTDLPPQTHGNNLVEIIWTIIPTAIVAVLFVLSWQTLNKVDPVSASPDVHVRATAARFQWTFTYFNPDGSEAFQVLDTKMVVPVGRTVQVSLRSPDVIHAFYVPRFLFKRDVVPGRDNRFDFKIDEAEAGQVFRGQCAELCGAFHGAMQFSVQAATPAEYETWFADQVAKANAPSPSPAASGAPGGEAIALVAQGTKFDKADLSAAADTPFTISFDNQDAGTLHNVEIKDQAGASQFQGEIFAGPGSRSYAVPALKAGAYSFLCTVHPSMTGTLTVQ